MTDQGVRYVLIADVPADGVDAFREYENAVLPLLGEHGSRLERRLRSADGHREVPGQTCSPLRLKERSRFTASAVARTRTRTPITAATGSDSLATRAGEPATASA